MSEGTLEVLLVNAKDLNDSDYFCKMDPYVILTVRSQEQKSSVASGKGSNPEWNETFVFTVSSDVKELHLKIMDSDLMSDDFVGEAKIPLAAVFDEGTIPTTSHNVVKDDKFCGEIRVSLTFTPKGGRRRNDSRREEDEDRHRHGRHERRDSDEDEDRRGDGRHERRDSDEDEDRRRHGRHGRD